MSDIQGRRDRTESALRRDVGLIAGTLVGVALDPPLYTPLEVIILKDKFRSRLVNAFADFVIDEIARLSADRNP